MRILSRSLALGALVLLGMSNGSLLAQNQNDPGADAAQAAAPSQAPIMQAQPRQAPNPQRQAMRMAKKLSLTPDQAAQLEPILAERLQQIENLRSDSTVTPADRQARMRTIRQGSNSKIEALLSPAQQQQYGQMKANHRARKQQGGAVSNS